MNLFPFRTPFRREWILSILAFGICLVLVNFALGFFMPWLKELPQVWQRARLIERMGHPVARAEPFFSSRFVQESLVQPGGWQLPEDSDGFVQAGPFAGEFFHVDRLKPTGNLYRRTVNHPGDADRKVILFLGGSTVYGGEVPDSMTLPSQFASELPQALPAVRFEVLNAGVYSATSTQELARLKYELMKGLRPRLVISYGGVNDVSEGLYFKDARSTRMGYTKEARERLLQNRSQAAASDDKNGLLQGAWRWFVERTYYGRLTEAVAYRRNIYVAPPHLRDPKELQELTEQTVRIYQENLAEMASLSRQYGFRFVAILQPQAYYGEYKVKSDVERVPEYDGSTPELGLAHRVAYPQMRQAVQAARQKGIAVFDLSLSLVDKDGEVFYDFCHLNSVGNKLVAKAAVEALKEELR